MKGGYVPGDSYEIYTDKSSSNDGARCPSRTLTTPTATGAYMPRRGASPMFPDEGIVSLPIRDSGDELRFQDFCADERSLLDTRRGLLRGG